MLITAPTEGEGEGGGGLKTNHQGNQFDLPVRPRLPGVSSFMTAQKHYQQDICFRKNYSLVEKKEVFLAVAVSCVCVSFFLPQTSQIFSLTLVSNKYLCGPRGAIKQP